MKKIVAQVALGILCTVPLAAEDYPIRKMIRDMGYTETYFLEDLATQVEISNEDSRKFYAEYEKRTQAELQKNKHPNSSESIESAFSAKDILKPRIADVSESAEMLPTLLRYHKDNPKSDKITRKLAVTTYELGQYKESLYWFTLTYQRNRSDFESLWNMASIADMIGDKEAARKFLKEYVRVDPNSAWGRMAKDILNSGYSASNMTESFEDKLPKSMISESGRARETGVSVGNKKQVESSGEESNRGMLVVQGDKYDLESFVANYKPKKNFDTKATNQADTLKGNRDNLTTKSTVKNKAKDEMKTVDTFSSKSLSTAATIKPDKDSAVYIAAEPLSN